MYADPFITKSIRPSIMNNIITIGLGLIGGSFNLDLKKIFPDASFGGIDKNKAHVQEALKLKLIDFEGQDKDIKDADLIVIATPVDHINSLLTRWKGKYAIFSRNYLCCLLYRES